MQAAEFQELVEYLLKTLQLRHDMLAVLKSSEFKKLLGLLTQKPAYLTTGFYIPKGFFSDLSFPLTQQTLDQLSDEAKPDNSTEQLFCNFYRILLEKQELSKIALAPEVADYAQERQQKAQQVVDESKQNLMERKAILENDTHHLIEKIETLKITGLLFNQEKIAILSSDISLKTKKISACQQIIKTLAQVDEILLNLGVFQNKQEIDGFFKQQENRLLKAIEDWRQIEGVDTHDKTKKGELVNQVVQKLTFGLSHYSTATEDELKNTSERVKKGFSS